MGCLVIERFAWTVIQLVHDRFNVLVRDVPETAALGKVLPDQTVGVFVQAALPRMVGMSKIHLRIEMFLDGFMSGELLAVVGGDRQRLVQIRLEQNIQLKRLGIIWPDPLPARVGAIVKI